MISFILFFQVKKTVRKLFLQYFEEGNPIGVIVTQVV